MVRRTGLAWIVVAMSAGFWHGGFGVAAASEQASPINAVSLVSGKTQLDSREVAFQITDCDGNGDFCGDGDRLKLDLDGDGEFNPLREQFACRPIIKIGSRRYTLAIVVPKSEAADPLQTIAPEPIRLTLSALIGTGFIIPKIAALAAEVQVTEFMVTLVSDGGVHVVAETINSSIEVPIGNYRVESLRVDLKDTRHWRMSFAKTDDPPEKTVTVADAQTVEFDVLGSLNLDGKLSGGVGTSRVSVSPTLTTTTGLYLDQSLVGLIKAQDDNRLTASLVNLKPGGDRDVLAVEGTGFACGTFCPITFAGSHAMTTSNIVVLQFDAGPIGGPIIRVAKPGVIRADVSDALDFD